ncbi:MAG TPA: potassium channel family protein [Dokdonella sp.]|jgi:hypothetical protein|nr:potassium channel family protein [Dokdonella sp.]
MFIITLACITLIASATIVHYEALSVLSRWLPGLPMRSRAKLLVVVFLVFIAHVVEIALYGAGFHTLANTFGLGGFNGMASATLSNCLYFSAETYSSLGFGDLTPSGPIRLLAGIEALNGLLLIGWSASYIYISMERFWSSGKPAN